MSSGMQQYERAGAIAGASGSSSRRRLWYWNAPYEMDARAHEFEHRKQNAAMPSGTPSSRRRDCGVFITAKRAQFRRVPVA